jgi:branched-chain amino acid transport system substrate-binding protein
MGGWAQKLWVMVSLGAVSCSLSRFAFTPCASNRECRDALGWGQVCAEQLCQPVAPIPRCTATFPTDLLQRIDDFEDRIVIGIQFDQSAFATETLAAQFAIGEVMKKNGLDAREFAMVTCTNEESSQYDNLTQDEANVMVSEYLADQVGVAAIIGPATSDRVEDAFLAIEPYGTLLMSPTATSPSLTPLDGQSPDDNNPGLLWRTAPPDDLQGAELSSLMKADGVQTAVVIVQDGNYGTDLGVIFKAAFEKDGSSATLLPYESASIPSLRDKIDTAEGMAVDGVLFISSEKSHTVAFLEVVVDRANDVGHTCSNPGSCIFAEGGAGIYLADGGKDAEIFEDVDGAEAITDRIKGTAPGQDLGPVYEVFKDSFDAANTSGLADSTGYTAYAYDAAWLVIYGAAWAHYNETAISGVGIARGLRSISTLSGADVDVGPSSWNSLRADFGVGREVNVRGASGDLDYDRETGETSAPIDIWCVAPTVGSYVFGLIVDGDCVL